MKKTFFVKLFTFFLFLFCASNSVFSQPKIELKKTEQNWGDVSYQVLLGGKISFKNTGDDTLKILSVRPGCGCTTVPGYTQNIAPGDTGMIGFNLNIKTYTGNVTKSISIRTNDPKTPRISYLLKCNVIRPFIITPRYISFDKLYVGEEGTTNTIIKNSSKFDGKITSIEISSPQLKINLKKGDVFKAGKALTLISSVTPTKKGHIRYKIKINLEHPDEKFIELSAYGRAIIRTK